MKRYGPPGNLDSAPHGTICQVDNEEGMDIHVQINKNQDEPKWVLMGTYKKSTTIEELDQEAQSFKLLKF